MLLSLVAIMNSHDFTGLRAKICIYFVKIKQRIHCQTLIYVFHHSFLEYLFQNTS